MLQLRKLRQELQFNKEMAGVINVLQGVASSEFYRLQKSMKKLDKFLSYLQGFFQMIDVAEVGHPFLHDSSLPPAMLLITSDFGFLGKMNVSIVNTALESSVGGEKFIVVGRQGSSYLEEAGREFISFAGVSDEVNYKEAERLASFVIKGFLNEEFCRTVVIYPHFVSFSVWEVRTYQFLPCRFLFRKESEVSTGFSPPEFLEEPAGGGFKQEERIIVEPSKTAIIEYLVKVWMTYMLYGIFWESKLSEWAARVMHLERSSYEIKQVEKNLRLQYFRILHEISDKNIREIFASRRVVGRPGGFQRSG